MALEDAFIGTGWTFPPTFANGEVKLSGGVPNIEESLRIIVTTRLGERIMRPEFGCGLDEEVLGPMNSNRLTWIENVVRRAIVLHEPRVDTERVAVAADQPEGRLVIEIVYTVRASNARFNLVFPFYLTDG